MYISMNRIGKIGTSLLTALLGFSTGTGEPLKKGSFFLGGIQVNEPNHEQWVSSLREQGMNTVSVTVYANQGVWNKSDLYYEDEDTGALSEIRTAKNDGLNVVFIPRVALDQAYPENHQLWHGMIMPKTEADLRKWFKTYQDYLYKWAKIAEEEGVEIYAIGSELKALTHTFYDDPSAILSEKSAFNSWYTGLSEKVSQASGNESAVEQYHQDVITKSEAYFKWGQETYGKDPLDVTAVQERRELLFELWEETIKGVREHYSGLLTYACNFDTYQNNALWPLIDIMGINAYFQLRPDASKPYNQLELNQSWIETMEGIRVFKQENNIAEQPLFFTELGYTFRKDSSVEPWSYSGKSVIEFDEVPTLIEWEKQPIDYQERLACLKALKNAVQLPENSFFRGLLYWKLSTYMEHEEIEPFDMHIGDGTVDPALEPLKTMFNHIEK